MTELEIAKLLISNGYTNFKLSNKNKHLIIVGEVFINQIRELLDVKDWEYKDGNAIFYLS